MCASIVLRMFRYPITFMREESMHLYLRVCGAAGEWCGRCTLPTVSLALSRSTAAFHSLTCSSPGGRDDSADGGGRAPTWQLQNAM